MNNGGVAFADAGAFGFANPANTNPNLVAGDANANATAYNNGGYAAISISDAIAPNNGDSLANSTAFTRGGYATSVSTSNNQVNGVADSGFAVSHSMGCLGTATCGSATALSGSQNGQGVAGTSSINIAGVGDKSLSGAEAMAGTGPSSQPASVNLSLTLTPNYWTHSATFQSGSSAAGTTFVAAPLP